MREIWTALVLLGGSVMDIRKKSVPLIYLLIAVAGTIPVVLLEQVQAGEILPGLIPGGAVLAVGKLSGCVGSADAILLLIIGALYGIRDGGELMMYSMLLAAVVSLILIALKRAGRKDTLPFIPFLLAGFILFKLRIYMNGGS